MHRFFVPSSVRSENAIEITGAIAHQITRVLRLRPNEEIVLLPLDREDAVEWQVRLVSVEARVVRGQVTAERPGLPEPTCAITLYPALLKGERFDWLLQKATEVGVAAICPIITTHTIRKIGADDGAVVERWRRIVTEAAEQSGRCRVPEIVAPVRLSALAGPVGAWRFVLHERITAHTLADRVPADAPALEIVIGPEGGFTEDEVRQMEATERTVAVSLGPRIVRAETAAIVAVTIALHATHNDAPPVERRWVPVGSTQE